MNKNLIKKFKNEVMCLKVATENPKYFNDFDCLGTLEKILNSLRDIVLRLKIDIKNEKDSI